MAVNKARDISAALRRDIEGGKFDKTGKLPSEHQLMRRFAVARETVRTALRDLAASELVEAKPGYGTLIRERATERAAERFGVVVPDAFHPFYQRICRGVEEVAKKRKWTLLTPSLGMGSMKERAVKAVEFAEVCVREKVCGVFLQPLQFLTDDVAFNRSLLSIFDNARIPVVLLDSDFLMPPMRSRYDLVGVDNLGVGWTLGRHLADAGARRIAYFTNPHPAPSSLNRGNGIAMAVVDAGLKWSRDSVIIGDPRDKELVKRLVTGRNRVDAFIAVNDWIAGILERTLLSIGVKIPDDVMLAGVNGDAESESAAIPITTVRQPCHEIGAAAVALMAMRMSDIAAPAREVKLAAEMIVRQSTTRAGHPGRGSRK